MLTAVKTQFRGHFLHGLLRLHSIRLPTPEKAGNTIRYILLRRGWSQCCPRRWAPSHDLAADILVQSQRACAVEDIAVVYCRRLQPDGTLTSQESTKDLMT